MHNTDTLTHLDPRDTPDPALLIRQVEHAVTTAHTLGIFERMQNAHDTRDCQWTDKTIDGRKRDSADGKRKAFPWAGAPDTEQRLVEEVITEFTDMAEAAAMRAEFQMAPRSLSAPEEADRAASVWKQVHAYYLDQFATEVEDQTGLFIDTALESGHSLMRISWHETQTLEKRTIGVEQVLQMFLETATQEVMAQLAPDTPINPETGQPDLTPELTQMLAMETAKRTRAMLDDPANRGQLKEAVMALDPAMTPQEAARVATSLQRGKPGQYYAIITDETRPTWRALKPWVHVWYPPETEDIQSAPWVCEALWLDEVALRTMATSEGWDEKWVERVLLHPGRSMNNLSLPNWVLGTLDVGMGVQDDVIEGTGDRTMFQITLMHYRAISKAGVPVLYRTVLHGQITDAYGLHECCPWAHGKMPYVQLKMQRKGTLLSCKGVAELGISPQLEVKLQRDARGAQVQLRAAPPLQEPVSQLAGDTPVRPGERLPLKRAGIVGEYRFLEIPAIAGESVEMENATLKGWNEYWGRGPTVDPEIKLIRRQAWVNRVLGALREAHRLTFQLIQEFTDDVEASTIAGQPVQLQATRAEIQGQFNLSLKFDVADLNLEYTTRVLDFISRLLVPLDVNGIIDRNKLIAFAARKFSPELADKIVRQSEDVQMSEIEDEQGAIARMAAGVEPPFKEGKNANLRAQVLRESVQKSPRLAQLLQADPDNFGALYENRLKQYDFAIQQQQNAQIGRVGGQPILELPSAA
jgi:hypothetical protein